MATREERLAHLAKLVQEAHSLDIARLQKELGVSYPTIRRDLVLLEERGMLRRVHGGALAPEGIMATPRWLCENGPNQYLKVRIGQAAARLVKPRQKLVIENGGGTTVALARSILRIPGLEVMTNSLEIAYLLNVYGTRHQVYLTGGLLRNDSYLRGGEASEALSRFGADLAFVSAFGCDFAAGITDVDLGAAEIKQAIIKGAQKTVLLLDHTKFSRVEPVEVAPLSAVATVVTTVEAPAEIVESLCTQGLTVVTC